MIEATQRKLREAQFFLRHLATEGNGPVRNDREAFGYYLSALLSAARSVTWAFQFEEKEKYDAWFLVWLAGRAPAERELLTFLKNQRNNEHKRGAADVLVAWDYIPFSRVPAADRSHPAYGFHWFGPPGTPEPLVGSPVHSFGPASAGQEVLEKCRRYVDVLNELVRDFNRAHSANAV